MDIQATKLELLKAILENENAEFIRKLADFVQKENDDFWDDLTAAEKHEIEAGIKELDEGKRVSLKSVLKKMV